MLPARAKQVMGGKKTWKLSPAQRHRLIRRYRQGDPLKQIAADFRIHTSSVSECARNAGESHRQKGRRLTEEQQRRILSCYKSGHLLKDIAAFFGLNPRTIAALARKAGEQLRPNQKKRDI